MASSVQCEWFPAYCLDPFNCSSLHNSSLLNLHFSLKQLVFELSFTPFIDVNTIYIDKYDNVLPFTLKAAILLVEQPHNKRKSALYSINKKE